MFPHRSPHRVVVLVLLLASWWTSAPALAATSPAPPSAVSQPASQDALTHPRVMQETAQAEAKASVGPQQPFRPSVVPRAARQAGFGGSLAREVFGFGLFSSLSDPTVGYPSWNFSLLTTVAVFGLHVNWDGHLVTDGTDPGWAVWNSSQMTNLLNTAHAAGTKVVLTIVLQDFTAHTPNMCAGLHNRAVTVQQTVSEVKAKGVDGVNVDYEGLETTCAIGDDPRADMTDLVRQLRAALPAGSYLSVDTYASSAGDPVGFFDIPGMAPNTDSFFVMAYDSDFSNYGSAPLNCSKYCLNPVSPLTGYRYNDTRASTEYSNAVPASKVILGLPYYSRADCVTSWAPNQYPSGQANFNLHYIQAVKMATDPSNSNYVLHRDAYDQAGQSPWSTWTSSNNPACSMEMYWDDTTSLGNKYALVNRAGLRGVGIWNLNQGGGTPELWTTLAGYFGWKPLGGSLSAGPDAASWATGRLDVFARGADSALWHRAGNSGSWNAWEPLSGLTRDDPGAVSGAPNRVDVFVRGADDDLWHKWWTGTAWSAWEDLGGHLSAGPDPASASASHIDVVVRGADHALWHRSWNGTSWRPWESLGGVIASAPGAVSWGPNRVDVFARGGDNALWHRSWDGTSWQPWESLGGVFSYEPDVSSCAIGSLDVFVVGADGGIWRKNFSAGVWGPWTPLRGFWTTGGPAAVCQPGTSKIDLFERGTDNGLWMQELPN
jgi:spore germination protein YaaH